MLVTITSIDTAQVFVSMLYTTLEPTDAVTTRRTLAQLEAEFQLLELLEAPAKVSLSFISEPTDGLILFPSLLPVFTNLTRPDPTSVPEGSCIWNSDDTAPNYSDGTAWRDSDGVLT